MSSFSPSFAFLIALRGSTEDLWALWCLDQVSDTTWQEERWRHILFFPRRLCLLEGRQTPVQPFCCHSFATMKCLGGVRFFGLVVVLP